MAFTRISSLCRTRACRSATSGMAMATTAVILAGAVEVPAAVAHGPQPLKFQMVRSAAAEAANCLANVHANVQIEPLGPVERMTVVASGLPKNTEFDLFVIQVPNAPFGLSWYQGDMDSNANGVARGQFIGRFNIETFIVAPEPPGQPAPVVHNKQPFPDANTNPATPPVHTFHLGLWFNSPEDAVAAGCSDAETPFNGDHTAGIQVLSTRNFVDIGPLSQLAP
jgi:hypothetical protein